MVSGKFTYNWMDENQRVNGDKASEASKSSYANRKNQNSGNVPLQGTTQNVKGSTISGADIQSNSNIGPGSAFGQNDPTGNYEGLAGAPNTWWGGNSEYGVQTLANNPTLWWDTYAQQQQGLAPGSYTSQFMANTYDPKWLNLATGGSETTDYGQVLANADKLAGLINQPGYQSFSSTAMVKNLLGALASPNSAMKSGNAEFQMLAETMTGAPETQISTVLDALGAVLQSSMPPETLKAYMSFVNKLSLEWLQTVVKGGTEVSDKQNFAQWLMQRTGGTGGL